MYCKVLENLYIFAVSNSDDKREKLNNLKHKTL